MKKPIRVLHVIGKMDRAGAETLILNIYRNIDRSKIQFDFVVHTNQIGDYDEEIKELGGKIYHAPNYKIYNKLEYKKFWNNFFNEHSEYKIIHGHIRSSASIYLKIAKKHGVYTICHSHNTKGKGIMGKFHQIITRNIPKYTDYFFGCSNQAIIDGFGRKVYDKYNHQVLNNGIEAKEYVYDKKIDKKYRKQFNLENSFIVGHVGRFTAQKNHKYLIDVFKQIKEQEENSKLVLIGRGELEQEVSEYINQKGLKEDVLLLGVRSDINKLLMMFDAFVFPSIFEGLGIALIEAEAAGLKCFVSENIQKEAVISNDVYRLQLSDSPKTWADTILREAKNYKKQNNLKLVEKNNYDIKKITKQIEKFYKDISKKL